MKSARTQWRETILICRKCSKKLGGGFGAKGRKSLRKILSEALHLGKGRRALAGIVEVDCLKLCPKNAVTLALGGAPQVMWVVPRKTPAADVVTALGLERLLAEGQAGVPKGRAPSLEPKALAAAAPPNFDSEAH